ncbi:MAG: hypothetical protein H6Q13_645 [Bacteroidetes bacterium]|jgi:anaerobic ribonucleoside-triphosphate reductase activating protein|nr:hypothetical protein [Bacteroidota bacterium]
MLKYVSYDIVFQEIPDEVTLAINLSNCPNHCSGCHSPYLMENVGIPLTEEILDTFLENYNGEVSCICFMGGDAAPHEVERLAKYLHKQMAKQGGIKVGWYSGKSKLPEDIDITCFQFIKLGPYIEHLGSLKSPTTNQKLYKVSASNKLCDITYSFWGAKSIIS